MAEKHEDYWFPAKRYGWGWGPPVAWQGWMVLALYVLFVVGLPFILPPELNPKLFALGMIAATGILILVCLKKGEPPRWRWGGRDFD